MKTIFVYCFCILIYCIYFLVENTSAQNAQTVSELPKELMDNELLPKYKRDLVAKLKCLRAELNALQPQSGHCRLEVSRNEIFEVSTVLYSYLRSLKEQFNNI